MLALLKKSGYSASKETGSPWRADFRIVESLPDTKTVRTTFLVNMIVFTILGSLVLYTAYREIELSGIKADIAAVQAQIASALPLSKSAESSYKAFQDEEKKLKDVQALARADFSFPDYLINLASLMPSGVKSTRVEYRGFGQNILVSGTVEGQDATASETASTFISTLQQDANFKTVFSSVTNSNLGRNAATGTLNFELIFTFSKPVAAK